MVPTGLPPTRCSSPSIRTVTPPVRVVTCPGGVRLVDGRLLMLKSFPIRDRMRILRKREGRRCNWTLRLSESSCPVSAN